MLSGLPHPRGRHLVGLDRGFEPVHPHQPLRPFHGGVQLTLVGDVGHPVVGPELAAQFVTEVVLGVLADSDHVGAHPGQRGHEPTLVLREERLNEDDVHGRSSSVASDVMTIPTGEAGMSVVWVTAASPLDGVGAT